MNYKQKDVNNTIIKNETVTFILKKKKKNQILISLPLPGTLVGKTHAKYAERYLQFVAAKIFKISYII